VGPRPGPQVADRQLELAIDLVAGHADRAQLDLEARAAAERQRAEAADAERWILAPGRDHRDPPGRELAKQNLEPVAGSVDHAASRGIQVVAVRVAGSGKNRKFTTPGAPANRAGQSPAVNPGGVATSSPRSRWVRP
jgi:hypothetical protein